MIGRHTKVGFRRVHQRKSGASHSRRLFFAGVDVELKKIRTKMREWYDVKDTLVDE